MRFDIRPAQENFLFFASLDHQFRKTTTHDEHHLETQSYEIEENTNVCMKNLLWEGGLLSLLMQNLSAMSALLFAFVVTNFI